MITLANWTRSVAGFASLSAADHVRSFVWYLNDIAGCSSFTQSDVTGCFVELGLRKPSSIGAYLAKMVDRGELLRERGAYRVEHRALDELRVRFGQRPATVYVHRLLAELPANVTTPDEREFLDETLRCFQNGAYRASIVMAWNLAFAHLCEHVFKVRLADFNARLPLVFPKEKLQQVSRREDFSELRESQVLAVCRSAGITTPSLGRLLDSNLALRNAAAHPSGVTVKQLTAEAAIAELVDNVVLKF